MIDPDTDSRLRRDSGMSMLEMTAALFVFSVGLMAAFQTFHYTLARMRVLKENAIATRAIQNEIEAIRGGARISLTPGELDFTDSGADLDHLKDAKATINVRPYEGGMQGLFVLEARVEWIGDQARPMENSVTTLMRNREVTP